MQIQELLTTANSIEDNVSERDVVDYFKGNNFGHWPSESSMATFNAEGGSIVLSSEQGTIKSNHDITPAGKKWLLGHFFKQAVPQSMLDLKNLDINLSNDTPTIEEFHERIVKRMSGISKFIKTGSTLLGFTERKRTNLDGSKLYSYDIVNMDKDLASKHALMVPAAETVIYVFEEYKKKIVRSRIKVNGRFFEGIEAWERAEYIAMTPVDIFDVKPISRSYLQEVFSLTEAADEITNDKMNNILQENLSQENL